MAQKPSIPKGTRDFGPEEMSRIEFIQETLKNVFRRHGYQPLETPAVERLDVLTGKYGEEGDRLIFKILNSGDFLRKTKDFDFGADGAANKLIPLISEKALRYDLTVPFARYVVMNQHKLNFPFKRYQVQQVWRADRPQKGRYREFTQCDVDVIGSTSLLNEAGLVMICDEAFGALGIEGVTLRLNNRKILEGMAHYFGAGDRFIEFVTILDKLDKVGFEGVMKEMQEKGFSVEQEGLVALQNNAEGTPEEALAALESQLCATENPSASAGIAEMRELFAYIEQLKLSSIAVKFDLFLARGLTYYTGTIYEAVTHDFRGSILGGGRYDNLTGVFGLPGVSGVGISFGADRIYDVMMQRGIARAIDSGRTRVLLVNFGGAATVRSLDVLVQLQKAGIAAELYPDAVKPKKQFKYADQGAYTHVIVIGPQEVEDGVCNLKNLATQEQQRLSVEEAIAVLAKD